MKIRFSDIFSHENSCIVHGCNAQGVMGSGFALAVKERHVGAFYAYLDQVKSCLNKNDLLGTVSYFTDDPSNGSLVIANAITQLSYGRTGERYVNYEAVQKAFNHIAKSVKPGVVIRYPKIGAGLGGGEWDIIAAIIEEELQGREHYLHIQN